MPVEMMCLNAMHCQEISTLRKFPIHHIREAVLCRELPGKFVVEAILTSGSGVI